MRTQHLPLEQQSISQLYFGNKATFEVPIYQRNYAWEKDEISALVQDVYDSLNAGKDQYFIGTLVTFHKGDQIYEVIDGQQRLTTINLLLRAMNPNKWPANKLTYRSRKKSNYTLESIPHFNVDEIDRGIKNGFEFAKQAIKEILTDQTKDKFADYFLNNVHIIHYQVPKDIDLNHYFEIMNSRGEQLEKHEIVKARLIEKLSTTDDRIKFNQLWEACSDMNVYIQQKFGKYQFDWNKDLTSQNNSFTTLIQTEGEDSSKSIGELIYETISKTKDDGGEQPDKFQAIIDFPNFLLIVLKLTRLQESTFLKALIQSNEVREEGFILDDKTIIREFENVNPLDDDFVKKFGFNLLKARYLLDNYIVHHSNQEETPGNNPWKLQTWHTEGGKGYPKNICDDDKLQQRLVHLLSMFEVSYSARQRKNYLFYCLQYLFENNWNLEKYADFLEKLAEKYFKNVYLDSAKLNENNTPLPRVFDQTILDENAILGAPTNLDFNDIFGDGTAVTKGVPLFVFNYLDYKLWNKYAVKMRGEDMPEGRQERRDFFEALGCSDFHLDIFKGFYFSRTRKSLEHFFAQANVRETGTPTREQINCFGNFAMIGNEANSSGSNWSTTEKCSRYLDSSKKIHPVSVASLKLSIMMQKCKDNLNKISNANSSNLAPDWTFHDMKEHQDKMLDILLNP